MAANERIRIQADAAQALGVSQKTLQNWARSAWWQSDFRTEKGYDVAAIHDANPSENIRVARGEKDDDDRRMAFEEQQCRLKMVELRLGRQSGELVPLADVVAAIKAADDAFVRMILDIPIRAARLLPEGPDRVKFMAACDQICRDALREHAAKMRQRLNRGSDAADSSEM